MRLALAQINSVVGDIDGNSSRVVEWLEQARETNATRRKRGVHVATSSRARRSAFLPVNFSQRSTITSQ